jgi:hypothetical protein
MTYSNIGGGSKIGRSNVILILYISCSNDYSSVSVSGLIVVLIQSGPLYPLGRLGTVHRAYEPFKAYNISLKKSKNKKEQKI